jgi:hypothetical protein
MPKAVEILEQMVDETFNPFREEALRMGIEALEQIRQCRKASLQTYSNQLLSEVKKVK